LLEIFGYMLDDGNMYQIMPFFSGNGRNGKKVSVLEVNTVLRWWNLILILLMRLKVLRILLR